MLWTTNALFSISFYSSTTPPPATSRKKIPVGDMTADAYEVFLYLFLTEFILLVYIIRVRLNLKTKRWKFNKREKKIFFLNVLGFRVH